MPTTIDNTPPHLEQAIALYESVGWSSYTAEPDALHSALAHSTWLRCLYEDDVLVALARVVSDDATMAYLQDVLVHPEHQRRGHGQALVEAAMERFAHCRQFILMTDDDAKQTAFYESLGLLRTDKVTQVTLRTFVRLKGLSE
ncbi:MAG: GNAT superfamily N-acetyltransferase [Bradymonadia bacterium]|jgi:GNAT superfamily N-acetyltransferase